MRRSGPALALLAALSLAGCLAPADAPDDCGAAELTRYLGRPSETLPPQDGPARVIPPGSAVTLDYNPARLNADLDADGTVTRLWCG